MTLKFSMNTQMIWMIFMKHLMYIIQILIEFDERTALKVNKKIFKQ